MNPRRILLLSNVRPSRSWKIANRIVRELPDAEVCGIVQRLTKELPVVQQLIAAEDTSDMLVSAPRRSRARLLLQSVWNALLQRVLWCIHGCPRHLPDMTKFTSKKLVKQCNEAGWPLLQTSEFYDHPQVLEFVRENKPDLAILLGDIPLTPELRLIPTQGCIRVCQSHFRHDGMTLKEGGEIAIDYFSGQSDSAFPVARLKVPLQSYDGPAGYTLKTDLIADDLVLQTVMQLTMGNVSEVSTAVSEWIEAILSPYIRQLEAAPTNSLTNPLRPQRHRPAWKLCLDTLLLCSLSVVRNWSRRWSGRYPVLILTHHLVSDRRHRMGITTEIFWQQVRFLKKHYRIVSLREATELLQSGKVTAPTVVLTFDDGYADNFVNLRAVAEEMEIPVAHFIVTQSADTHREFEHDLAQGERGALPLTYDQIRYWSLRGAEFGSHTRTHFDCGSTDRARLEWELVGARIDLETQLGRSAEFFAFPFGQCQNISSEALEIAATAYKYYASGFGGDNVLGGAADNRHLLRRILHQHPWELELELQSVFDLVERIKRWMHLKKQDASCSPGNLCTPYHDQTQKHESGLPFQVSN